MAGYIGNQFKISGRYKVDEFTSVGGTTYTLSSAPGDKNNIQVSAGGLVQYPSAYSVSGTTLTLSGVPATQKVVVRHMGDTIPFPNLDAGVVTGAKIAAGAVTNAKTDFQPGTIFKGDGSSARGKIVLNCEQNTHGVSIQSPAHSAGASYTLTLPPNDGAANEALTTDGSGVLSWAAAGGGAWTLLQTTAVTSPVASVGYTGISTTYDCYVVVVADLVPASDGVFLEMTLGDSGGLDIGGSDYEFHVNRQHSAGTAYLANVSAGSDHMELGNNIGNVAGEGINGIYFLNTPSDGTMKPSLIGISVIQHPTSGNPTQGGTVRGARLAVITLTQLSIAFASGNIATGRISIYGVAHA